MFTIFTPFFTLVPVSATLYSTHAVSHVSISEQTRRMESRLRAPSYTVALRHRLCLAFLTSVAVGRI